MSEAREQYVEREFKLWKDNYVITFDQEFIIKAMLGLQYQYNNTSDDHIKTKKDIIETIQRIKYGIKLNPNKDNRDQVTIDIKDALKYMDKPYLKALWYESEGNFGKYLGKLKSLRQFGNLTWSDSDKGE